jgi:hypothetical protein
MPEEDVPLLKKHKKGSDPLKKYKKNKPIHGLKLNKFRLFECISQFHHIT